MSRVPAEIGGIGSTLQKLRVSPAFDPIKAQIAPDEYFLLSRIDGQLTLRDVLLATGLPVERGLTIVMRLRSLGALLLPNEKAPPPSESRAPDRPGSQASGTNRTSSPQMVATSRTTSAQTPATSRTASAQAPVTSRTASAQAPATSRTASAQAPVTSRTASAQAPATSRTASAQAPATSRTASAQAPATSRTASAQASRPAQAKPEPVAVEAKLDLTLSNPTPDELTYLAESCDLPDVDRRRILAMTRLVDAGDPWGMLGLARGADARTAKRAYFKLSKDVHPDRYYGRQLGSFAERLSHVFEGVSRAYERLTQPEKSSANTTQAVVAQSQTPQEYAAELFARATALEVGGDPLEAMKLFSATIRLDPQTKYLRRSASCALAAGQPHTALEHAKKAQGNAPTDPSLARLLATAFKACGKLTDAEDVLVMAMALKSDNDVLMVELRNNLAEVRRLLNS